MDHQTLIASRLCPCACPFCCRPSAPPWRRSIKRRLDPEGDDAVPSSCGGDGDVAARVEVENEVTALREMVANQQLTIQELCAELDEERSAAATAASETMSMILRLQHEKAEAQMEARQFKRFAEEKMDHDQQELIALEDLLFKRDEAVQSLTLQVQAYRHRLLSCGVDPNDVDAGAAPADWLVPQFDDLPTFLYPPLRCNLPNDVDREEDYYDEAADVEKYAFAEIPHTREDLENLEHRICQLETLPGATSLIEKGVIEESPGPSHDSRQSSADSHESMPGKNSQEVTKGEDFPASGGRLMDDGEALDNMSQTTDRIYTIDAVHGFPVDGLPDDLDVPKMEKEKKEEIDGRPDSGSPDIKSLYMRLQALEADRESMRHEIISMRTEKAQLVLLREIAQQLAKEASPERKIINKKCSTAHSYIVSVVKWILALIIWRKKASRTKYTFGSSNNIVGLMVLLDKTPRISNWRCVTRING
ncbi:myosin-binding protein 7 [Canna indica]|uniref:Myosin-binding protein 7 n=1 Tax=Canna indica TaxID=4628 RepID=A0AAQ3QQ93_9LILI|nr:myosin-binding protein 7 [Canna indica]